jgi:hypothetical protein
MRHPYPIVCSTPPPVPGQHTSSVLGELLGISAFMLETLCVTGII